MSELNFEASRKHRICFTRVICMLREAHESDLVSYIETRLSTSASETTSECFVCADTTNHNSVLKRSHGFINPFDCIVNIPFKTVPYQVMFCPIREKRKGFVSCSTLRAVHIRELKMETFSGRRQLQPDVTSWFLHYCACSCSPHCRRAPAGDVKLVCLALWREREYLTHFNQVCCI